MTRYGIDDGHRYSRGRSVSSDRRATRVSSSASARSHSPLNSENAADSRLGHESVASRGRMASREPMTSGNPFDSRRIKEPRMVQEWPKAPSNVYDFETAKKLYDRHLPQIDAPSGSSRSGWAISSLNMDAPKRSERVSGPRGGAAGFGAPGLRDGALAAGPSRATASRGSAPSSSAFARDTAFVRGAAPTRRAASARGSASFRDVVPGRAIEPTRPERPKPEESQETQERRGRKAAEPRGLKAKLEARRRESRHKRADREFESHVPADRNASDPSASAPRAGVYKGEMGRNQKRAQRMQAPAVAGGIFAIFGNLSLPGLGNLSERPKLMASLTVCLCVVLSIMFVYPSAQDYYVTLRGNAQMQAELAAINERNDEIASRVAVLSTNEGVEDKLREDYGWVNKGENAVSVSREGSSYISTDAEHKSSDVVAGSIPAPETWYSPFLDMLFMYDNTPVAVAAEDTSSQDVTSSGSAASDGSATEDTASAQADSSEATTE